MRYGMIRDGGYHCRESSPMTRQYCHIGSRTIAYLDSAPGDRRLAHAGPAARVSDRREPVGAADAAAFPQGWRLITPDLRGFGGTHRARIR